MSDIKSRPIELTPTERHGNATQPRHGNTVIQRYRSTYTPDNAAKWKHVFDEMIATRKDQQIESSVVGLKPNTMYAAAQDALKWLADNMPLKEGELANQYAALRPSVSVTRTAQPEGLLIYFKRSIVNTILSQQVMATQQHPPSPLFKDEFNEWLSTAQSGDIFEREVMLTEEQRKWLLDIVAGLGDGAEYDLSSGRVKVMR